MTKKIKKIQILRHLTQIASIFLLPGLYILAFDELKTIYKMVLAGNLNFLSVFPSLIELTTVIFASIIIGRFFCGWFCTFGAYNDLLHQISKKIFKINFKINSKVDAVLKYTKYLVLAAIVVFSWNMGNTLLKSASPWDSFAQITDLSSVLSNVAIGFILLILISIGAFYIERFFCRYLCPLGALFTLISKISIFKLSKPNDKCGKCRICTSNCSMGLPLYKVNIVCGGECINCFQCVEACPRKNVQATILGENINPALASSVAIAAFAGIYALNNTGGTLITNADLTSTPNISMSSNKSAASTTLAATAKTSTPATSTTTTSQTSATTVATKGKYKDGTYTGSGTGFRGGTTTLSLTVKNGKIASIQTVSTQDSQRFYGGAEGTIFNEVITSQGSAIDTVSGATYSSNGIIGAVQAALAKAQ